MEEHRLENALKEHHPEAPMDLLCEYCVNPVGLDVSRPRFPWVLIHEGPV
ncbi:hypothetical protein KEJ34_01470 [Candidatus Bathyarchaeota archaeon]|nr:hypothetical protein [Candidatus Bathyarchaeota archaeon]